MEDAVGREDGFKTRVLEPLNDMAVAGGLLIRIRG